MTLHHEISFEDEICADLAANGWLYEEGAAQHYDRVRALYPPDLIEWIRAIRPDDCDAILRSGEAAILDRVRKQIDQRGTLDVLRHGIEMLGVRGTLKLAEFKPALAELAVAQLAPISAEMARLMRDPAEIDHVLARGAARAREIAAPIVRRAYEITGLVV